MRGHAGNGQNPSEKKYENSNASYMCVPSRVKHGASIADRHVTYAGQK